MKVENFEDYDITRDGRVYSLKSRRFLAPHKQPNGYEKVCFSTKGVTTAHYVHRLVASAYLPNKKKLPEVNHIDFNRHNNNVNNLEWVDRAQNLTHYWASKGRTGHIDVCKARSIQEKFNDLIDMGVPLENAFYATTGFML